MNSAPILSRLSATISIALVAFLVRFGAADERPADDEQTFQTQIGA